MRIGILALQGDFREHAQLIEGLGHDPILVRLPHELDDIEGLIIPGGESTTIGKLADRFGLMDPLRAIISTGLPTLGTCAGLIFLANATTGPVQHQLGVLDVVVERNAFGRQVDSFETDLQVTGIDSPVHAVFIRAPVVEKMGAEVDVLAAVHDRPVMVRSGNIVAVSFHPELAGETRIHQLAFKER